MSRRYKKENPNLTIARIAKDFGTPIDALQPHLDRLIALGLVCYHKKSKASIRLTEDGKLLDAEL